MLRLKLLLVVVTVALAISYTLYHRGYVQAQLDETEVAFAWYVHAACQMQPKTCKQQAVNKVVTRAPVEVINSASAPDYSQLPSIFTPVDKE